MTDTTLPPPSDLCPIATPDVADVVKKVRELVGLVNEEEMAAILQVSYATLATWRTRRRGPPSIKLGKKVFYALTDFEGWVQDEVARQRPPQAPLSARAYKPAVHVDETQSGLHVHY